MTRTDAHAPKNLVTEDYEYLWAFDSDSGFLVNVDMDWWRSISNWDPATAERNIHQCHHCGARIRYGVILRHVPSGYAIVVGETCADGRFEMATSEFHRLRKAAELDRKAQRIKTAALLFLAKQNPEVQQLLAKDEQAGMSEVVAEARNNEFVSDVRRKLWMYGDLSDRQVEAIAKVPARVVEQAERAAREEAEKATAEPVPHGTEVVTGEILSTRVEDTMYGCTVKMLVKDDRGFKVWGTLPQAISAAEKGDRVTFTANLSRSEDDQHFGFFARPRKAELLTSSVPCGDATGHAYSRCNCPA